MSAPAAFTWPDLARYSREEVGLVNWYRAYVPGHAEWQAWASDALCAMLESPDGTEISLARTSTLPGQHEDKSYSFTVGEVSFGRDADNDVVCGARSVARKHARIVCESSRCFLEDLGTPLGTYVNQRKLAANERVALAPGDRFSIFPYRFEFALKTRWARETKASVSEAEMRPATWAEAVQTAPQGHAGFAVSIHPCDEEAYLEVSRAFLEEVLRRLLRKLGVDAAVLTLAPSDTSVFEYLLISVLERANRSLVLPFQFALGAPGRKPAIQPQTRGQLIRFTVGMTDISGAFRLFLPYPAIAAMQAAAPELSKSTEAAIDLSFTLTAGSAELRMEELLELEAGDIVVFEPEPELLFPGFGDRGWKTMAVDDNLASFRLDKYFERRSMATDDVRNDAAESPAPDLSGLPVRLHVVLGEKEMTYAQASRLVSGTVVDLDRDKDTAVSLWINGKRKGEGRLVQIEGRLGVQVAAWSEA